MVPIVLAVCLWQVAILLKSTNSILLALLNAVRLVDCTIGLYAHGGITALGNVHRSSKLN